MSATDRQESAEARKPPVTLNPAEGFLIQPEISLVSLSSMETVEVDGFGEMILMSPNFTRSVRGSLAGLSPNQLLFGKIHQKTDDSSIVPEEPDFIYNQYFIVSAVEEQDLDDLREGSVLVSSTSTSAIGGDDVGDELAAVFTLEEQGGDTNRLTNNADRNIINSSVTAGENPFESRSPQKMKELIEDRVLSLSDFISGQARPQENLQRFKPDTHVSKESFKKLSIDKRTNLDLSLRGLNRRADNA